MVDYKIYNSLFAIISTMFALSTTPIWSEVTNAFAQKEYHWIKALHKRLNFFVLIAVIFAVSTTLFIWNAALSSIINGLGKLKTSFVFHAFGAVINIPLTSVFVLLTHSWISVILANIISILPSCVMQEIWLNKYIKPRIN